MTGREIIDRLVERVWSARTDKNERRRAAAVLLTWMTSVPAKRLRVVDIDRERGVWILEYRP